MPILEQGYEPYRGPVGGGRGNFLAIAGAALRRNRRWYAWVLLLLSLLFGSAKEYFLVLACYVPRALGFTDDNPFFTAFANHPNLYPDMMATQTFWALVMAITVGAGEIAEDLRTGALVFYLGRPLTRLDYVLGKVVSVSVAVLLVTLLPTLLLFTVQAVFEGRWEWLAEHAAIPFAALGYSLLVSLFASGFVLGVGAVARRRRWATVASAAVLLGLWFTALVVAPPTGWTGSGMEERRIKQALAEARTEEETKAALKRLSDSLDPIGSASERAEWRALAPDSTLAACGRDLFGTPVPSNFPWKRHWVLALGVPLALLGVLWRRVRAVEIVS
ncbi:MAG: ABC transporter permease subunit [Planctomycetaceae bacterium]|nr:ABC transporter permease subunit [Planctomycetota bacterium]NUN52955.1 ABC transporter permease subunit [Planctomycetaceae bacterium]